MGFMYSIKICEISHQTFGPSHWKWPTCPMIFMNTGCESRRHFSVQYKPHMRLRMDDIVGILTCQTDISLHPCQEIVQYHKLGQNNHFVNKFRSSVATILPLGFRGHVTVKTVLGPNLELGLESSWALTSTISVFKVKIFSFQTFGPLNSWNTLLFDTFVGPNQSCWTSAYS